MRNEGKPDSEPTLRGLPEDFWEQSIEMQRGWLWKHSIALQEANDLLGRVITKLRNEAVERVQPEPRIEGPRQYPPNRHLTVWNGEAKRFFCTACTESFADIESANSHTATSLSGVQPEPVQDFAEELQSTSLVPEGISDSRKDSPFSRTSTSVEPQVERDNCQVCHGESGGVRGNENIIDGVTVCDYCSWRISAFKKVAVDSVSHPTPAKEVDKSAK